MVRLPSILSTLNAYLAVALSRASVVFALQTWLAETPEQKRTSGTPGYFSVGMACMFPQVSGDFFHILR